ncbi:oligosaccharide flippase family protein [Sphingobacterium sp. SRCM116780]|uniref:oligosaccharide flippase family protein n=1 Tax=Sphingobacterium sp. SRCM116780 TaxID=2907623 RepID=UPI001F3CBB29|nr:oligosaccharide flippase family protein [Sphingobacterium sp. SRCM116780]UIR55517.1 oligosaccharide flippase family protein [Sphingobacterium sp. SRCM116780]
MSIFKKFAGQTLIYGLSTIVSRLLNFILTPIFVRKFPASTYGIFTNMYSWAAMINAFLAFGMETTYFRYLQKVEEKDKSKVFNNSFIVTIFTSLLFLLTILLFSNDIARWFAKENVDTISEYKNYIYFVGLTLVADALAVVPFAKIRANGRPMRYGMLKLVSIITFVLLSLTFIVFIPYLIKHFPETRSYFSSWYINSWLGYVFLSNFIASALTLLMLLPEIKTFTFKIDKALIAEMFRYSFPILIANISYIINENLDKIMMPELLPKHIADRDVGIYGAIAKIAVFLSIFVQAFRLGAEPFFFSYAKNENSSKVYALIMEYFVIAMMIVMIGLSVNIEWLKYFIEGGTLAQSEEYWSGLFIIPVLLFNYVMLGIYMNLSVWYKLSDQTRYGLYISGIGALITILLCYVFIPQYSYVGAIYVTSITYFVMVFLSYFWGQKNYPIPYKIFKIGAYMLVGTLIVYIHYTAFDRNFWIGNIMLIAYILGAAFVEKKTIIRMMRTKN